MFRPLILMGISVHQLDDIDNESIVDAVMARKDMRLDDNGGHTFAEDSYYPTDHPECKKLLDKVQQLARSEIHSKLVNENQWAHILEPNESTMFHTHSNTGKPPAISWAYYASAPKDAGNIVWTFECNKGRVMQEEELGLGKLVFFSGEVPHFTKKNISGETRVSISGNLNLPEDTDWSTFQPENWLNYVGVFNG